MDRCLWVDLDSIVTHVAEFPFSDYVDPRLPSADFSMESIAVIILSL